MKKKLLVVLIATAIGIWGYNLYQFKGSMAPEYAAPAVMENADDTFNPDSIAFTGNTYVYKGENRDPFQHRLFPPAPVTPVKKAVVAPVKKTVKPFPRLVVQGIMGDSSHPMAIILDAAGATHLSRPGKDIGGAVVKSIGQNSVVFAWEGEETVVELKK